MAIRIDTEQFQQMLQRCGLAFQGLRTAIDRANRLDRLAARIAATSLVSVREALDLVAECEKRGIDPERIAELSALGLDPQVAIRGLTEAGREVLK